MWSDGSVGFFDFCKWHDFCLSGFVLFHLAALSYIIVLLACKYYGRPPAKFRWGQSNVNKCVCANDVSKQSHLLWYFLPLFLTLLGLQELCRACRGSTQPGVQFNCLSGIFFFFPPPPRIWCRNLSSETRTMDTNNFWGVSLRLSMLLSLAQRSLSANSAQS